MTQVATSPSYPSANQPAAFCYVHEVYVCTHDTTHASSHCQQCALNNVGRLISKRERDVQSSTRILLLDPQKLVARRTMTAKVASRRHRTAVTINAVLSEYGFTKLEVTPDGGARAGRTALLELLLLMVPMLRRWWNRGCCNCIPRAGGDPEGHGEL